MHTGKTAPWLEDPATAHALVSAANRIGLPMKGAERHDLLYSSKRKAWASYSDRTPALLTVGHLLDTRWSDVWYGHYKHIAVFGWWTACSIQQFVHLLHVSYISNPHHHAPGVLRKKFIQKFPGQLFVIVQTGLGYKVEFKTKMVC